MMPALSQYVFSLDILGNSPVSNTTFAVSFRPCKERTWNKLATTYEPRPPRAAVEVRIYITVSPLWLCLEPHWLHPWLPGGCCWEPGCWELGCWLPGCCCGCEGSRCLLLAAVSHPQDAFAACAKGVSSALETERSVLIKLDRIPGKPCTQNMFTVYHSNGVYLWLHC